MKLKALIVSVVLLAVLSALVYWTSRPEPPAPADPRVGKALVDPSVASSAAKLVLSDSGKTVILSRDAAGLWIVESYYGLPVDFTKLSQFVNDLVAAKVDRFVTASPERLSRLEFKDTRIDLQDKDAKSLWSVTLGKTPDSGTGHFIEFGTEAKAFLTSYSGSVDADAKGWADAQLTTIKDSDVAQLEFHFPGGEKAVVSRTKADEPWTLTPASGTRKVGVDKISGVLSALDTLRFSDSTATNDPMVAAATAHGETIVLTTYAKKTYTFTLGRKPEEKKLKAPVADAKSGPSSLGNLADVAPDKAAQDKPGDKKPGAPEFETIPAGPVFVSVATSDPADRVNGEMAKRAYQADESVFLALPAKSDDLLEPIVTPAEPASAKPSN